MFPPGTRGGTTRCSSPPRPRERSLAARDERSESPVGGHQGGDASWPKPGGHDRTANDRPQKWRWRPGAERQRLTMQRRATDLISGCCQTARRAAPGRPGRAARPAQSAAGRGAAQRRRLDPVRFNSAVVVPGRRARTSCPESVLSREMVDIPVPAHSLHVAVIWLFSLAAARSCRRSQRCSKSSDPVHTTSMIAKAPQNDILRRDSD